MFFGEWGMGILTTNGPEFSRMGRGGGGEWGQWVWGVLDATRRNEIAGQRIENCAGFLFSREGVELRLLRPFRAGDVFYR